MLIGKDGKTREGGNDQSIVAPFPRALREVRGQQMGLADR
jgi:hypothetical protein